MTDAERRRRAGHELLARIEIAEFAEGLDQPHVCVVLDEGEVTVTTGPYPDWVTAVAAAERLESRLNHEMASAEVRFVVVSVPLMPPDKS